ncbi:zinc finger protein 561-like [Melanotaenia boesemani]|uniref:zinc finger protein 561-like n=1 Tax=Melanotaenia boesemani TaxID=1250792 RepID=UPI001C0440C7|nr:zinc finger protein 561-like [Melanotaenia boesemani]
MKRGSSVLQPPSDAAKRHTHPASTRTKTHSGSDVGLLSVPERTPDTHTAGSSPFPAATSLFSPDVTTKMASDLLIRLSEATQKAQMHPGSQEEAEQQDEPGVALSPDSPGASPEPPSLTHTPDGNTATDTLASDLLRKLAERQEVSSQVLRLKEEEEPMDVSTVAQSRPVTEEIARSTQKMGSHHLFTVKSEGRDLTGNKVAQQLHPGAKMVDQCLLGFKMEDRFYAGGCQSASKTAASGISGANKFQFPVKIEHHGVTMKEQLVVNVKSTERLLSGTKMSNHFLSRVKMEDQFSSGATMENQLVSGAKMATQVFSGAKMEEQLFFGAKMEDQLTSGAKMADQCLRAVLWQDMSVNLASTLLHQLSEKVSKSTNQQVERTTPPIRSSPDLKVNVDQLRPSPFLTSQEPSDETQTSLSRDQTTGCSYFFRCHVCGFETEGQALFQSHMTEHRQWEHNSFTLHCCMCDLSTNQEAEMRAHMDTHIQGDVGELRCPITLPAASSSALAVAVATQPEKSTSEHRCRICQRLFPGQQELLVHFQGHRQGNQYRCDRCGHLTRTANKLVEHVRVHTGERPFTCDLCPYSAKRRDSLRLHCKVKHGAHGNGSATESPGDVHTHRSYVPRDNQRASKHVQRLHTPPSTHTAASSFFSHPPFQPSLSDRAGWRDLSPLLPITTLISLKPHSLSSSSSAFSSTKHSFLGYLGLTTSL